MHSIIKFSNSLRYRKQAAMVFGRIYTSKSVKGLKNVSYKKCKIVSHFNDMNLNQNTNKKYGKHCQKTEFHRFTYNINNTHG